MARSLIRVIFPVPRSTSSVAGGAGVGSTARTAVSVSGSDSGLKRGRDETTVDEAEAEG